MVIRYRYINEGSFKQRETNPSNRTKCTFSLYNCIVVINNRLHTKICPAVPRTIRGAIIRFALAPNDLLCKRWKLMDN